ITQQVPAGTTAVTAFTVPAGQTLIVTDVLLTNTSTAVTCGAAINRAGGTTSATSSTTGTTPGTTVTTPGTTVTTPSATTPGTTPTAPGTTATLGTGPSTTAVPGTTPTVAGTITQTDSTITGPLCLAPRTTTVLNLTTGIEFGPGQAVQLVNAPDTTATAGPAGGPGARRP